VNKVMSATFAKPQ